MYDNKDLITLCIPTNNPENMNQYFLKTVHNLCGMEDYCTIAINFQKPYTEKQISDIVEYLTSLGFHVVYSFNEYEIINKGEVPFNRIRNDCALLNKNSFLYANVDDDFEFKDGAYLDYLRTIHFMLMYKDCGVVNFVRSYENRYIEKDHIGIAKSFNNITINTGRGLVFKNCRPDFNFHSDKSLEVKGSGEELMLTALQLHKGRFIAVLPTGRCINSMGRSKGFKKYGWTRKKILDENQHKFLSELSGIPIEKISKEVYLFIKPEHYYSIGGIDHEKNRYNYLINYSQSSEDSLIKSIHSLNKI